MTETATPPKSSRRRTAKPSDPPPANPWTGRTWAEIARERREQAERERRDAAAELWRALVAQAGGDEQEGARLLALADRLSADSPEELLTDWSARAARRVALAEQADGAEQADEALERSKERVRIAREAERRAVAAASAARRLGDGVRVEEVNAALEAEAAAVAEREKAERGLRAARDDWFPRNSARLERESLVPPLCRAPAPPPAE